MNNHTKEPWKLDIETDPETGLSIAEIAGLPGRYGESEIFDAERIVTCVNEFAGIPNPAEWMEEMKKKLAFKDKQIAAREEGMRVRERVAALWETRHRELKKENRQLKRALEQMCHCRIDEYVDTSVGQEYERCPACKALKSFPTTPKEMK